jgi:hypothetical protein
MDKAVVVVDEEDHGGRFGSGWVATVARLWGAD